MDAKRLILPFFFAVAVALGAVGSFQARTASAEVPYPETSPYLRAAIQSDIEAKGHSYGGDCRFDVMYLAPGKWCSMVQSVSASGAVVTYGPFASDDITEATFVRSGEYGWKNSATGVGSPALVPALAAQPGPKPDSWLVEGINFTPGEQVALFDGSGCGGEQRCPGDHRLAVATAAADGSFKATVQFDSAAKPLPGQTRRLIQASGGSFLQVAFHQGGSTPPPTPIDPSPAPVDPTPAPVNPTPTSPSTPVDPTPSAPSTGDDDSDTGEKFVWGAVAGVTLTALAAIGIVTVGRRR